MFEEVQRVVDAVNAVRAIQDPRRRARAITQLLRTRAEDESDLREERRTLVLQMRADKVTFRDIAKELGVSVGTVQDIVRGHSGPWGRRPKKAAAGEESSDKPDSPGTEGT